MHKTAKHIEQYAKYMEDLHNGVKKQIIKRKNKIRNNFTLPHDSVRYTST